MKELTRNSLLHQLEYLLFFVIFIYSGSVHLSFAQNNKPTGLQNYLKHSDFLLKNDGKWKAVNNNFNAKDENSPSYFGYGFSKGINNNTLKIKIERYVPKRSEWVALGEGFYTWDHKKKKVIYQGSGSDGALVYGESEMISGEEVSLIYNITLSNGSIEKNKSVVKFLDNEIQQTTLAYKAGKWEVKYELVWNWLELATASLTFMSTREGNFEIYSMDAHGNNLKNLSCNKATDYALSYLKDGRLLFYSNREGNNEIYLLDADGENLTNLTNNPASDRIADISPDGKRMIFSSNREDNTTELYLMEIESKNVKRLTNNNFFEDAPSWSPDGKQILFSRDIKAENNSTHQTLGNGEIFIMNHDGTGERRLTNRPGFDGGAQFSPDGNKIAFYGKREDGNFEIFIMNPDGSNIVNLTEDELEDYSPSWSYDGKWIAYTKGNSKNYDVWIINLDTRIKTRLTTQPKRDESPIWEKPFNSIKSQ